MNQLQTNMETIAKAFNISKDQLGRKEWQIVGLLSQNSNLTGLLADKDTLLNKSQVNTLVCSITLNHANNASN